MVGYFCLLEAGSFLRVFFAIKCVDIVESTDLALMTSKSAT